MGERLTVVLDDGVSEMLVSLAGSSRRQGEYLSKLIRAAWENEIAGSAAEVEREGLRFHLHGLSGQMKALEGRVMQVERELAALIAQRQP